MPEPAIYLDNNATTPMVAEVIEAMEACARCQHANPASQHRPGREARNILESARDRIAELLGATVGSREADQLIFTSGATEANNLALCGLAGSPPGRVILSAIEHPSIWRVGEFLAQQGFEVQTLPVDCHGLVRLDRLEDLVDEQTRLVSVMYANHETGILQPIAEVAAICNRFGVPLHTDAVQAVGKLKIDFTSMGVDALTLSGHKFHGPGGIGGLLLRSGTQLQPMLRGGHQQGAMRPGTESVEPAVGMRVALESAIQKNLSGAHPLEAMRDSLEAKLCASLPDVIIHCRELDRAPHTCQISFLGADRQAVVMALDQAGIAVATGTACESGASEVSRTLLAMGCEPALLDTSIRLSVGSLNTMGEMDLAAQRIAAKIRHLREVNRRRRPIEAARRGV